MRLRVELVSLLCNYMSFRDNVFELVKQIPVGRVMTYGQIASICGQPSAARVVGGIAHFGDTDLPWHRIVNKRGGMASGYPGGKRTHQERLVAEGVVFDEEFVARIEDHIWWPDR
jgi:methylated-DNA-protein-cysteine methyltransferase-like protein